MIYIISEETLKEALKQAFVELPTVVYNSDFDRMFTYLQVLIDENGAEDLTPVNSALQYDKHDRILVKDKRKKDTSKFKRHRLK